jgi:hypothetical protein
LRRTAAATQHNTKQNSSNQQHEQLVVQPLGCIRVVFLVHILMVVVVQHELQITLDPRPWTLGHALSFFRSENPSEKYTAVTKIQQSAESHDVGRDALLPPSTIDARRTKVK